MKPLFLVTALLLLAGAASAATPTPAPAAVQAKPVDPDKPVCKEQRIEGTRFMKRVCLPRAAWVDLERKQNAAASPQGFDTPESPPPYNPIQTGRGTPMR